MLITLLACILTTLRVSIWNFNEDLLDKKMKKIYNQLQKREVLIESPGYSQHKQYIPL